MSYFGSGYTIVSRQPYLNMLVTLVKGDRKIKLALLRPINENAIGTIEED